MYSVKRNRVCQGGFPENTSHLISSTGKKHRGQVPGNIILKVMIKRHNPPHRRRRINTGGRLMSMRKIPATTILFAAAALFFSATCRADEYIDRLFATPSAAELDAVWEATQYEPKCVDFKIGEVYKETDWFTINYITYTSDGYRQTGIFARPRGEGKFPLVMMNHAGFSGISLYEVRESEEFLARGYAVAIATYRGEGGVAGKAEGPMDVLGNEAHDILNLMECAAADPAVDPERIAMFGTSHGGGLTVAALARTGRVKVAATLAAPLNLTGPGIKRMAEDWKAQPTRVEVILQILVTREGIRILKNVFGVKDQDAGKIPERRVELMRRSAALFADRIKAPLYMYVGAEDPVAHEEDGETVAQALKAGNIESKITVFQGEAHAIKPESAAGAREEIYELFSRVLKK